MRVFFVILHILLGKIIFSSAASTHPLAEDGNPPHRERNVRLSKRANVQSGQYLNLPNDVASSTLTNVPILSTSLPNRPINHTAPLHAAQVFTFRVPHSTIELHITTTHPIPSHILSNALLVMHEYLNDHIAAQGDGPLAPKDDPFVWQPDGPLQKYLNIKNQVPGLQSLSSIFPVALKAQSVKGESMTWSVLLIAVEGLYLCLPAVGRAYGAQFEIWDWNDQAQWGFGEVKAV